MIHMMPVLQGLDIGDVIGDGAYDTIDCREVVHELGGNPIFPPDKNAVLQKRPPRPSLKTRDEGRALWKKEVKYHRRSRVETLIFRYKTLMGEKLSSRKPWTQSTEVTIKLDVLNKMMELGMPKSYRIEV